MYAKLFLRMARLGHLNAADIIHACVQSNSAFAHKRISKKGKYTQTVCAHRLLTITRRVSIYIY